MSKKQLTSIFALFISTALYAVSNQKILKENHPTTPLKVFSDTTIKVIDTRFTIKLWQDEKSNKWKYSIKDAVKESVFLLENTPSTVIIQQGLISSNDAEKVARLIISKIINSESPWVLTREDLVSIAVNI